jgi:2-C-methyl-D-erythritol 2,4-cyclodiphosphate synthase
MSTGIGWDTHRLVEGRPLVLGGVRIEHDRGLLGHSDADVLTHAVIDAMLGAAGLGDIGEHYPDTDPRYAGADSMRLLDATVARLAQAGVRAVHVDVTVLLEAPKLSPLKAAIRESLAGALSLAAAHVNIKATRGEGMGFIGRAEGIAALAVVTVEPADGGAITAGTAAGATAEGEGAGRRLTAQPLLSVADVDRASRFYAELLDADDTHGGRHGDGPREYTRLEVDGRLVLQLHAIDVAHHHGGLATPGVALGNGVAVWFATGDFDAAAARAHACGAQIVHDVHVNPNARQREIWLRDPDGYLVVLAEA